MAINQFAKISPLVNSNGELLQVNGDGSLKTPITPYTDNNGNTQKLKNNELGILYNKSNLVIMKNGKLEIFGDYTFTMEEFLKYVADNNADINHSHDGEIISVIDKTTGTSVIYVIDSTLSNGYRVVNDHIVRCIFAGLSMNDTPINYELDSDGNKTNRSEPIKIYDDAILNNIEYMVMRVSFMCPSPPSSSTNKPFTGTASFVTDPESELWSGDPSIIATFDIDENNRIFQCTDVVNVYKQFTGPIYLKFKSDKMPSENDDLNYIFGSVTIEYMIA